MSLRFLPRRLLAGCALLLASALPAAAQIYDQPGSVSVNEDTSGTFNFKVAAWGIYRHVGVTSANQALIPNGNISVTFIREFYEFPSSRTEWRVNYTPAPNANGSTTFNINANDGAGIHNNATVTVTVHPVNDAPVFGPFPSSATIPKNSSVGSQYLVDFSVSDIESIAATTVTAASSNTGLVPNNPANLTVIRMTTGSPANTFRLVATPSLNATGSTTLTVTANDGEGGIVTRSVTLNVTDEGPVISNLNISASTLEDTTYLRDFTVSDRENIAGTVVTATSSNPSLVPNAPANLSVTRLTTGSPANTFRLTVNPAADQSGSTTLTVSASEGGKTVTAIVLLTVIAVNDPPVLTVANFAMNEDTTASTAVTFVDVDTPAASVTVTASSSNTALVPSVTVTGTGNSRTLTFTPLPQQFGTSTITVTANDGAGGTDTRTFTLTVNAVNDLPVAGSPYAVAFDGHDDFASASAIGLATGNTPHTIEAWVFPTRLPSVREWILHLGTGGNGHHWLFRTDGTLQLGAWGRDAQVADVPLPIGTWTHVAAVWDGSTYEVYFDGLKVGQTPSATGFNMASPTLSLANRQSGADANFQGQLDEVRVWNRALLQGEIQALRRQPLRGTESGLLLYLPFDEGQGATAFDYAAAGGLSHATLSNGAAHVRREPGDRGVLLDGLDDHVLVPHHSSLNAFPLTVTAWIQTTDIDGGIASKYADGSLNGWTFRLVGGRLKAWYFASSFNRIWDGGTGFDGGLVNDGRWHHVALVIDAAGGRLYVDGAQTGSHPWFGFPTAPTSTDPLRLGRYSTVTGAPGHLAGQLNDVTIWNRALSQAELTHLRLNPPAGTEPNLVAYYRFRDASGAPALDTAGGDQNGAYQGGATPRLAPDADTFVEFSVVEETPTPIYLQGFDIENKLGQPGGSLTFTVVSLPAHGTLQSGVSSVTAGFTANWADASRNPLIYTPFDAYNGPDSFTFRLTDGSGGQSLLYRVPIIVEDVNDNPTISPIANRVIEEGTDTGPIPFIIDDEETPAGSLFVSALSSDTRLVPPSGLVFGGSGPNRTLTVTPAPDEVGTVTITVTVTDTAAPAGFVTIDFRLRVDPRPAYALVDLGALGTLNRSSGLDISDSGWAVGLARSGADDAHALLYRGLTGTRLAEDLSPTQQGIAFGINASNAITGFLRNSTAAPRDAFVWQNNAFTSLAGRISGSDSIGYDLNDSGDVVGSFSTAGNRRAFYLPNSGSMVNLGTLAGFTSLSEALGINALGHTVGYSQDASGRSRGFFWNGGALATVGPLPGHDHARAHAINDDGLITGFSAPGTSSSSPRRAFVLESGVLRNLGVLPNGSYSVGWDINAFGQVVGEADRGTVRRAFLNTAGVMRDLNDLIHDTEILPDLTPGSFTLAGGRWELVEARAINSRGVIVGIARRDANDRAFMAVPAWVIGRQIPRPEGAVAKLPEIELIRGNAGDTAENSFYWSEFEKRLYAIRPVAARLRWFTSLELTSGSGETLQVNTERIDVEGISVWPKDPAIHVATAPVEIEPRGVPFDYTFQQIRYDTTSGGSTVDPTSKTFNNARPGYSVAYYLKTDGGTPNPDQQRPYFEVVRTVLWNDAAHLRQRDAVVGQSLADPPTPSDPGHQDYFDKQGWILNALAYYDGAGEDRAHDRPLRRGPIIPVNLDTDSPDDDLVVVWYRLSRIGVAWASVPARYRIAWPDDDSVPKIVIASGLGSGSLPAHWTQPRAYHQPNRNLPGYNPNEEHALVLPANGGGGQALFALRFDLNDALDTPASLPYALLKYRDRNTGQWGIQPYKVVGEEAPHFFRFSGFAGREIAPPYPLSILPLCEESHGVSGPYWEDWQGRLYARAAGPFGESTDVVLRWAYPLQIGFFYDLNLDGTPDAPPGSCVSWLDRRPAGSLSAPNDEAGEEDVPIAVTYRIAWPDAPVLQIGETLTSPKNGLPAVRSMASVQFVYDDLTPAWNPLSTNPAPIQTLARLYDPLSARAYPLAPSESIPDEIRRTSRGGKEFFDDLPPSLENRLIYDPISRALTFTGILDASGAGDPLLLPNVLFSRERDVIKELAPDDTAWAKIVDELFEITRNPNRVDLVPADGNPDRSTDTLSSTNRQPGLRLGLITDARTNVVAETLGSLPKALTAALGDIPSPAYRPLNAFSFDGTGGHLDAGPVNLDTASFTLEFWARADSIDTPNFIAGLGTSEPDGQLIVGFDHAGRFVFRFGTNDTAYAQFTPDPVADTEWHHWAVTFNAATREQAIFRDGSFLAGGISTGVLRASGTLFLGRAATSPGSEAFHGALDEIRLWNHARTPFAIARDRSKALTGHEDGLIRYYRADDASDSSPSQVDASLVGGVSFVASTAPTGIPPRYLVLAENNSPDLAGLPIQLHIIRVDDGPFQGDLKVLYPGNVFDQRLTLRHSSEFGGDPDPIRFQWFYKPDDAGFNPTELPQVNAAGEITDARGWILFTSFDPPSGQGVNDVTIGTPAQSGLLALSDNWFICRHRGFNVRGATPWSGWIGDPSGGGTPRAQLAEGWVKRVIRGLNPFDARTADFHANASATYASMVLQAGERFEGDIAFNPDGDNLNSLGLIEAYTTVLRRGKSLSIEGTPPVDFNPANNALLLAASRIADLYMLLGNEAYADAQDPTIGFTSASEPYQALATSIFTFQNQLDSLLAEELALLRGRDDTSAGVAARPVYNRLFWNFTLGEGEVAYQQSYSVNDQNRDGFIDERDARILFPQGHGDAWGHYLTAIKSYYDLLRHPSFTWIPRSERVLVAGVPVEVDYLDERKFAQAAAARAKTGREVLDLTYRASYVDDPDGQWQGYRDTDPDRAWGVADWASRAGQGAYFDWLVGNTVLPATDPNPENTGIRRIDRTTVTDLDEVIAQYAEIQATLDNADVGLNPLGLSKGAMAFDIDPTFLSIGSRAVQGLAHFEQLNERAIKALKNAQRIWNEANAQRRNLRANQDSVDAFTANARAEEINYRNRLIDIFGYPYSGDIGPGRTYPSGYDGPDLYHYMYVPVAEITGETVPPSTNFTGFFKAVDVGLLGNSHFPTEEKSFFKEYDPDATDPAELEIDYPQANGPWAFATPSDWGQRRAPGRLQQSISDVLQATAKLKFAGQNYDGLVIDINDKVVLLNARFGLDTSKLSIHNTRRDTIVGINSGIGIAKAVQLTTRGISRTIQAVAEAGADAVPKVVGLASDVTGPIRLIMRGASLLTAINLDAAGDIAELVEGALELSKDHVNLNADIQLLQAEQKYEVLQQVKELETAVLNEINLRLEVFHHQEAVRQAYGRYLATLAEGQRVLDSLILFRKQAAAQTTEYRYRDMAFRIFRNEAIQKYRATFDLAARYVYLSATAYDYESNFLGTDRRAASRFFDQIVRQRQLGVLIDGEPIPGHSGLADIQGRMIQNWEIIEPQFGLNNPQLEAGRFSLRRELFRLRDENPGRLDDPSDATWRALLRSQVVPDVWSIPEFRRYCRPFAPESAGPQPALVLRFPTTIQFGQNYFGRPLSGGDSAFDPSFFSTKINAVGIGFPGYDDTGLSRTPRVYLVPVGLDILRAPTGNDLATRQWRVLDQAVPVPFAIGANDFTSSRWVASQDTLSENFGQPRRFASLRAFHDNGSLADVEMTSSTRLVARSVWNTEWMLIIPGGTLLADPQQGLDRFIQSISDINLLMMVYSFAGQ
ncbi:MAG: tandem-95 repeat protein [Verrucomicrobiae bacterium]|nr:tandem-95 repeat protein [Verrucomicrobiae bacterium]